MVEDDDFWKYPTMSPEWIKVRVDRYYELKENMDKGNFITKAIKKDQVKKIKKHLWDSWGIKVD